MKWQQINDLKKFIFKNSNYVIYIKSESEP